MRSSSAETIFKTFPKLVYTPFWEERGAWNNILSDTVMVDFADMELDAFHNRLHIRKQII